MNSFIDALLSNPFLLMALLAGCLASIVGGLMGSYVVVKRISFISGSISHSILAGVGFFLWLSRVHGLAWMTPLFGAIVAGVASALLIGYVHSRYKQREDSVIAAVWSIGMAVGILFLSQTPGFSVELTNFLIGNIVWVSSDDLMVLLILDAVVVVSVLLYHRKLMQLSFDEDQAFLQGVSVQALSLFLLILVSISVVILMQVVGVILVMTMLTLPAAIASNLTKKLSSVMMASVAFSMLFCIIGTFVAFHLDWPVGATIALTAGCTYVGSLAFCERP